MKENKFYYSRNRSGLVMADDCVPFSTNFDKRRNVRRNITREGRNKGYFLAAVLLAGCVFRFNDHFCSRSSVKSKFLRLGIRVYIQLDIVYRGRIRYKERERKGEGGKRRWCVKLTARLPVSRDYCSNSRARRVTVRTLGRYSLIHKRPRSLVSGFVREIVACYIPWLYTFLQSRPVVIAQRYFRRAKGKRMLPC